MLASFEVENPTNHVEIPNLFGSPRKPGVLCTLVAIYTLVLSGVEVELFVADACGGK